MIWLMLCLKMPLQHAFCIGLIGGLIIEGWFLAFSLNTVLLAANGDEAVGIAASHDWSIQMLITDVIIPGMSGRALSDCLTSAIPSLNVLFMSDRARVPLAGGGRSTSGVSTEFRRKLALR